MERNLRKTRVGMKNIKKIGFILCLTLMITTIMPSSFVTETVQAATPKVKLSETKKKISIGESFQLSLKSVKSSKVKWSSTDKQVATVSKSGKVKGKLNMHDFNALISESAKIATGDLTDEGEVQTPATT